MRICYLLTSRKKKKRESRQSRDHRPRSGQWNAEIQTEPVRAIRHKYQHDGDAPGADGKLLYYSVLQHRVLHCFHGFAFSLVVIKLITANHTIGCLVMRGSCYIFRGSTADEFLKARALTHLPSSMARKTQIHSMLLVGLQGASVSMTVNTVEAGSNKSRSSHRANCLTLAPPMSASLCLEQILTIFAQFLLVSWVRAQIKPIKVQSSRSWRGVCL